MLAVMNTGSEYGFGGVIAALPGFVKISDGISGVFSNQQIQKLHFEKRLIKMELPFLSKYEFFIKKFDHFNDPYAANSPIG
ncbi:hypothetical protein ABEY41_19740 [Peribacillus butanolivorans]|uniref:hypothetical protein n=1 Tax=Peribacillus butanolivorans TaxID=421767 RepID=UPI003D2E4DC2